MKREEARKRLLKESAIAAAVLGVLGGGAYFVGTMDENARQEAMALENQINPAIAMVSTLKDKYSRMKLNFNLYQSVAQQQQNGQLGISRDAIYQKFEQFRSRYYLNGLRVTMQAPRDLDGANYKRATNVIEVSNVDAIFYALTDQDIYVLLSAIQRELPGRVRLSALSIDRKNMLTTDTLQSISVTGEAQLLDGSLAFTWFGLKSPEPSAAAAAPARTGP